MQVKDTWRPDPDIAMPASVQERHHALCEAARECYRLRNIAPVIEQDDFEAVGDTYFRRALALSAEWDS